MREIHGLGELARIFEKAAAVHEVAMGALAQGSAGVMHEKAIHIVGDSSKLRDLEQSTQDDRVARGYSANDPLYRDGRLIRDKIEQAHAHDLAGIGSSEPVMAAHEFGFYNVRAKKFVAPRPVFTIAMTESAPEIENMIEDTLSITMGEPSIVLKP